MEHEIFLLRKFLKITFSKTVLTYKTAIKNSGSVLGTVYVSGKLILLIKTASVEIAS